MPQRSRHLSVTKFEYRTGFIFVGALEGRSKNVWEVRMPSRHGWRRAAQCGAAAKETPDPEVRKFLFEIRDAWIEAANQRNLVERDDHDGVLPASLARMIEEAAA
jgi:hypothetical protein